MTDRMSSENCERCRNPRADGPHVCGADSCIVVLPRLDAAPDAQCSLITKASIRAAACAPGCRYYGARLHPDACAPAQVRKPALTPVEMLGEALELMERARVLALDAYDQMPEMMISRINGVVRFGDARQWIEWVRREAEATHGR